MFEEYLIEVLARSVEKHGEMELTNIHLMNIVSLAKRRYEKDLHEDVLFDVPF